MWYTIIEESINKALQQVRCRAFFMGNYFPGTGFLLHPAVPEKEGLDEKNISEKRARTPVKWGFLT